jgi:hypothetical protein
VIEWNGDRDGPGLVPVAGAGAGAGRQQVKEQKPAAWVCVAF